MLSLHTCIFLLHELIQLPTQAKLVSERYRRIHCLKFLQYLTKILLLQVVILDLWGTSKSNRAYHILLHGFLFLLLKDVGYIFKSLINLLLNQQVGAFDFIIFHSQWILNLALTIYNYLGLRLG